MFGLTTIGVLVAIIFIPTALSVLDGLFRFAFDGIANLLTGDTPFLVLGGLGLFGLFSMQGALAHDIGQGIDAIIATIIASI